MAGRDIEKNAAVVTALVGTAVAVAVGVDKLVKTVTGEPIPFWFNRVVHREKKKNTK